MGALGRLSGVRGRSPVALAAAGAVTLASFAAAALAHAAIDLAGQLTVGGDDYADRAHVAVGPVFLGIVGLVVIGLVRIALAAAARRQAGDPVLQAVRCLAKIDPRLTVLAVATGGFLTLLAMEFSEQIVACGHIIGVADALGGSPMVGLMLVIVAGALVALLGARHVAWLAAATALVAAAVAGWLRAARDRIVRGSMRAAEQPIRPISLCFLARCSGLRAPPSVI
jgi:hypothetical protein